jgi:hypothetical protein
MEAVDAAILMVEPAGGQKRCVGEVAVDDRAVGDLWTHHAMAAIAEHIDQVRER